jgi:hypothetical protein
MNSEDFKQLIEKRERWYKSTLENDFDFSQILSGLYSDSSHFIYEILQNAEDAKANVIDFTLFSDKIEIIHNGTPFNYRDVESITSVGRSTKGEDITAIGKFGVGFKSVFAITQSPTIRSEGIEFTIKNFVVPIFDRDRDTVGETLIRLPFDHQSKSREEIHSLVSKRLENLDLLTLLFLKNIRTIRWSNGSKTGVYTRSFLLGYLGHQNVRRIKLESTEAKEEYLVFEKVVIVNGKSLRVEIAYKLERDKDENEHIVQAPTSKLFVFFETNEETHLKFLIQGAFRTTPARDNIPYDDEVNNALIKEISCLVGESLPILREMNLLDSNFLKVLPLSPLNHTRQQIYKPIADAVLAKFKSDEALIPIAGGGYEESSKMLYARKEIAHLFDSSDSIILFNRPHWMSTDITAEIRDFFVKSVGIPEVTLETLLKAFTVDYLSAKDIKWLVELYRLLKEQRDLLRPATRYQTQGIIRETAIIRLDNGEQICPYDSTGKVQCYLPASTKRKAYFKTVDPLLIDEPDAKDFLKELGISEPDIYAEISEYIVPKYSDSKEFSFDDYCQDFMTLLIGYQELRSDRKLEFLQSVNKLKIVLCEKQGSSKKYLVIPGQAYFPTPELKKYFSGCADIMFVSSDIYGKYEKNEIDEFFNELDVAKLPRRKLIESTLSWDEKKNLRGTYTFTRENYNYDYELEGLNNFLKTITKEKSVLLWELLLKLIESQGHYAESFFQGVYSWFYYSDHRNYYEAHFLKSLRNTPWLLVEGLGARKPESILASQLGAEYKRLMPFSQVLIEQLKFKSDLVEIILEQMSPENREKMRMVMSLDSEQLTQVVKLIKERAVSSKETETQSPKVSTDPNDWKPESSAQDAEILKQKFTPSEQPPNNPNPKSDDENETPTEPEAPGDSTDGEDQTLDKKKIGRWGEEYVLRSIVEEHTIGGVLDSREIIWLNSNKDVGRGCDFIIKVNGVNDTYIEVKSTISDDNELFNISGRQWEFARDLFENGKGDKYWIYCVYNAGKKNARYKPIQNPIKLWKEGKLYAHPINFKI